MTYRAAYLTGGVGTVLTGPEHANLSDAELLVEARKELSKIGVGDAFESIDDAMDHVVIDEWTE